MIVEEADLFVGDRWLHAGLFLKVWGKRGERTHLRVFEKVSKERRGPTLHGPDHSKCWGTVLPPKRKIALFIHDLPRKGEGEAVLGWRRHGIGPRIAQMRVQIVGVVVSFWSTVMVVVVVVDVTEKVKRVARPRSWDRPLLARADVRENEQGYDDARKDGDLFEL